MKPISLETANWRIKLALPEALGDKLAENKMKTMVLAILLVSLTSTAYAEESPCLTALETCVDYEPVTAVCHKDDRPLIQFYGKPDIHVCERFGGKLDVAPGWIILAQRVLIFFTGENHL